MIPCQSIFESKFNEILFALSFQVKKINDNLNYKCRRPPGRRTDSVLSSSDSDIRFTRKNLGENEKCGCALIAGFLASLLLAGAIIYIGCEYYAWLQFYSPIRSISIRYVALSRELIAADAHNSSCCCCVHKGGFLFSSLSDKISVQFVAHVDLVAQLQFIVPREMTKETSLWVVWVGYNLRTHL